MLWIWQDAWVCVCMCAASRDLKLLYKCDVVYGLKPSGGKEECCCGALRSRARAGVILFVKRRPCEMTAIQMSTRALLIAAERVHVLCSDVSMLLFSVTSQSLVAFNFWWDFSVWSMPWLFCTSNLLNLHVNFSLDLCILVFYIEPYFIVNLIFCLYYSS